MVFYSPISAHPHIVHQPSVFRSWCSCLSRHSSGFAFPFAHKRFQARTELMSSQLIQSNAYCYLTSDRYGPNVSLSDGTSDGSLSLINTIFSSNNWQIFYQYLIRNYDYGAKFQLGIAEDSPTIPALMIASGNLTQQWNLTLWEDGTCRLADIWLGRVQMLGCW